jgi:hypothetical protein
MLYIKNRIRLKGEYQFFMHQFVETCISNGFKSKRDIMPSYKYHIRSIFRRILIMFYKVMPFFVRRKSSIIITSRGGELFDNIFPYYNYEIVPMMWDVWPYTWRNMYRDLKRFHVKTVFVTARSVAEKIKKELGINAYWIPEGIDTSIYKKGLVLDQRKNDILEMGRKMGKYHRIIDKLSLESRIHGALATSKSTDGVLGSKTMVFQSHQELVENIPNFKILVCFPQCDTNTEKAGDIETLTQRYWEGMLSRCLIVGRVPQELVDLIGYNPVINVNWDNPEEQLINILQNVSSYQDLVDKNYESAIKYASWESRMPLFRKYLIDSGYII